MHRTRLTPPIAAGIAALLSGCAHPRQAELGPSCRFLYVEHESGGGRWSADTLYRCGDRLVVRRDARRATPAPSAADGKR